MGEISPLHIINLSYVLAGNSLVALAIDSGGSVQLVVKGGRVLVPDGTIASRGDTVLGIFLDTCV